ncbi:hypothetical protein CDAR_429381 [Caerostris darwini]|uniref:Uncharacterized protein n=1 Tax=Caerostris darwini TaxID=1538125 RepID=A0AAV4QIT9_9ARAC|nr:hypothetical protein CDAR_429381 [Caerostris darwini]
MGDEAFCILGRACISPGNDLVMAASSLSKVSGAKRSSDVAGVSCTILLAEETWLEAELEFPFRIWAKDFLEVIANIMGCILISGGVGSSIVSGMLSNLFCVVNWKELVAVVALVECLLLGLS